MMTRSTVARSWTLLLRNAGMLFLAAALFLNVHVAVAQTTSQQEVEAVPTEEAALLLSELPEAFAFCFRNEDASTRFLLPHIRGSVWSEGWQESDSFLPVLLLNDTATLYFLEKDAQSEWHAIRMKELFSLADFSSEGHGKIQAIGSFRYWPKALSPFDGKWMEGSISLSCTVTAGDQMYVLSVDYETDEHAASGWSFQSLQVLPISQSDHFAVSSESIYFSGIHFDEWKVVRMGNELQYQYILNDQYSLVFAVETSLTEGDFDLLVMKEQCLLGEPLLSLSAKVDTAKHGNGKAVNLRARPEGKRIAKISNGTSLQVANRSDAWSLVRYGDLWGFIDARFLTETEAYEQQDGGG